MQVVREVVVVKVVEVVQVLEVVVSLVINKGETVHIEYPYTLSQTKHVLSRSLSAITPHVSILIKNSQTQTHLC